MSEQSPIPPVPAEPKHPTGPVRPKERIEVVDILRGLAVFGILVVNMRSYSGSSLLALEQLGPADQFVKLWVVEFLADDKFYTLFSFLFGLGFAIQMNRMESRGVDFLPLYTRRLVGLLLIGLIHTFFIWWDEILRIYAVLGFGLIVIRHRSAKTILVAATILLATGPLYTVGVDASQELRGSDSRTAQQVEQEEAQQQADRRAEREGKLHTYSQGSFWEIMTLRVVQVREDSTNPRVYMEWWTSIFSMFLLGLFVGRYHILENLPAHIPVIRRVLWWGIGLGLAHILMDIIVWHLPGNPPTTYVTRQVAGIFWRVGAPGLCFFYAAGIVLLVHKERWRKLLALLAPVGRTALSNHLFQSLVCTTIFYGYGFGMYGTLGPAAGLGVTVFVFAAQIVLSRWWLQYFRFGPVEWLWRTLTYGKLQPMRVRQAAA